jgi:hypothetical protein
VSDDLPVPRFEPAARASGPAERRIRLLVLAGGALVLALVASSVANAGRVSLRCVDGQLVPHRGSLLPVGEEPLGDPSLPPVPVPAAACEDEELEGFAALKARHLELTRGRIDDAIRSADRVAIESTVEALDAMADPGTGSENLLRDRRDLLGTIVDQKVEDARVAHQHALRWIERAREAGVDPARLRAAERALGLPATADTEPPLAATDPPPAPAELAPTIEPDIAEPSSPRAL